MHIKKGTVRQTFKSEVNISGWPLGCIMENQGPLALMRYSPFTVIGGVLFDLDPGPYSFRWIHNLLVHLFDGL